MRFMLGFVMILVATLYGTATLLEYNVPWATVEKLAGCEAAVVAGLWLMGAPLKRG